MGPDTQFAFTAELSQAQLAAAVRHVARRRIWVLRIVGLLVALYGLLIMDLIDTAFALFVAAVGVLCGLGAPVLLIRRAVRRLGKVFDGPVSYRIDVDGVRTVTRFSDGLVRWPLIDRLEQRSDLLLLWIGKVRVIPVVVGQLPPATQEALVAFAQSQVSAPPPASPAP